VSRVWPSSKLSLFLSKALFFLSFTLALQLMSHTGLINLLATFRRFGGFSVPQIPTQPPPQIIGLSVSVDYLHVRRKMPYCPENLGLWVLEMYNFLHSQLIL
jgi:hypothetical protein